MRLLVSSGLSSCAQVTENKEKMTPVKSYHASCLLYVNICKYSESKLACKWLLGPAVPLKQDEMEEKNKAIAAAPQNEGLSVGCF